METATQLATRLSGASRRKYWNPYNSFDWPAELDAQAWYMPPELISLHGTPAWEGLDEAARRRLSLYEVANLFSLVLRGEILLVQGLAARLYEKGSEREITDYLHHFADEENKHMIMFGEFCNRYAGKVYPDRKQIALAREYAEGEEDVAFYCMAMVVEELGDYYNVLIARDERVDALVRRINRVHHVDEARHLAFGRAHLAELFARFSPAWTPEKLAGFRAWLVAFLRTCWAEYYNPSVYRDAGIAEAYEVRQAALAHPACKAHRERASARIVAYFVATGLLAEAPAL
jgi:hypothetical protein